MRPTVKPSDTTPRPVEPRREEDPLFPKISEKQKLEQLRRLAANYPKWDANQYQRAIAGTFDAKVNTNEDYLNVINNAAMQNKTVVMLIGSGSDPATRHVIENSLKDAHSRNGRDAVYAFVDLDSVDRNSQIGRYAHENMPRNGQEPPFTMVFGMSRSGNSTNPVRAEAPSYYSMGAPDLRGINEGISRAKLAMAGQFANMRPEQFPNTTPRPDQQFPRPEQQPTRPDQQFPRRDTLPPSDSRPADQRIEEAIAMSLVQAQRQQDNEKAYNHFKQAIDLADSTKNARLQSATRTELGIACIKWGFKETGYKWIMEGASKNPAFYNDQLNQAFKSRLLEAGIPQASLNLMIENGKRDPNWYTKEADAGKKVEAAATNPIVTPQINPNPFNIPLDVNPLIPTGRPNPFTQNPFAIKPVIPSATPEQVPQNPQQTHLMPSPFKR